MTHPLSFRLEKHKKGGTLEFLIYGDIGMDFFDEGVSAHGIVEILRDNQDVAAIEVRINSGGGSAFDGIAIYNVLHQHPAPVTVFIDGIAASAASIIAMAGTTINIATGAMMMIHNSANGTFGDNRELRKMADVLAALDKQGAAIYMARNGLSLKENLALMAAETWFGAEEAVAANMADNVVGALEAVASIAATASVDLTAYGYKNVPGSDGCGTRYMGQQAPATDDTRGDGTPLSPEQMHRLMSWADNQTTAPQPAPGDTDMSTPIFAQAAGLPDGATDAEIVAKMQNAIAGATAATAQLQTVQSQLTAITAAVGAEGAEALGKIEAGKVALAMVEKQTAELAVIAATAEKDAHAALVESGKKEGKLTADLVRLFENKPSNELKAFLAVAPKTIPMNIEHTSDGDKPVDHETLTFKGKTYAAMSGNEKSALSKADPDQFQAMSDQYRSSIHPNAAL